MKKVLFLILFVSSLIGQFTVGLVQAQTHLRVIKPFKSKPDYGKQMDTDLAPKVKKLAEYIFLNSRKTPTPNKYQNPFGSGSDTLTQETEMNFQVGIMVFNVKVKNSFIKEQYRDSITFEILPEGQERWDKLIVNDEGLDGNCDYFMGSIVREIKEQLGGSESRVQQSVHEIFKETVNVLISTFERKQMATNTPALNNFFNINPPVAEVNDLVYPEE